MPVDENSPVLVQALVLRRVKRRSRVKQGVGERPGRDLNARLDKRCRRFALAYCDLHSAILSGGIPCPYPLCFQSVLRCPKRARDAARDYTPRSIDPRTLDSRICNAIQFRRPVFYD